MMKHWIPISLLVGGVVLGFALGQATTGNDGGKPGSPGTPTSAATGNPPKHSKALTKTRNASRQSNGAREGHPTLSIRQIAKKLELSPMAGMDFDALFDAYVAIRRMSPEGVRMALGELDDATSNTQTRMTLQMMLIGQWANQDGRGSVEYAMEIKQPMQKMTGMMKGLTSWAKTDPEAAYTWYQNHPGELESGTMDKGMMEGLFFASVAQQDTGKAFTLLKGLKKSEQKSAIMMMAYGSSMDPRMRVEFLAELEQIEDKGVRHNGMEGLVSQWAMQDIEGAVEFLESREWEGDVGDEMRENLARTWAHVDPEAALNWSLKTAGEQEDRGATVASQFPRWMGQNPEAATTWLENQPEDLRTDALYGRTASQLNRKGQYELAAAWAEEIEDDGDRGRNLGRIYRDWKGDDEKAAEDWFNGLGASMQAELEKGAEHDPVVSRNRNRRFHAASRPPLPLICLATPSTIPGNPHGCDSPRR